MVTGVYEASLPMSTRKQEKAGLGPPFHKERKSESTTQRPNTRAIPIALKRLTAAILILFQRLAW